MARNKPSITSAIVALARLPWRPVFHGNVDNPTVPGGKVAMWLIVDDDTGEGIVSVGCPPDRPDIPAYIAASCERPWLTRPDDDGESMTALAIRFNRAIKRHYGEDGEVDAHEVTVACMTIVEAYLTEVPARARVDLVNNISARLQALRDGV